MKRVLKVTGSLVMALAMMLSQLSAVSVFAYGIDNYFYAEESYGYVGFDSFADGHASVNPLSSSA